MVHSAIIFGLYGYITEFEGESSAPLHLRPGAQYNLPLLLSALLVFVPQLIVWVAWVEVVKEGQQQGAGWPEEVPQVGSPTVLQTDMKISNARGWKVLPWWRMCWWCPGFQVSRSHDGSHITS